MSHTKFLGFTPRTEIFVLKIWENKRSQQGDFLITAHSWFRVSVLVCEVMLQLILLLLTRYICWSANIDNKLVTLHKFYQHTADTRQTAQTENMLTWRWIHAVLLWGQVIMINTLLTPDRLRSETNVHTFTRNPVSTNIFLMSLCIYVIIHWDLLNECKVMSTVIRPYWKKAI